MKKTLLLSTIVASIINIAATTGSVEFYKNNTTVFTKGKVVEELKETKSNIGVRTTVKVVDSGLSFGANLNTKDLTVLKSNETFDTVTKNALNNSDVWAKYEVKNFFTKAKYQTKGNLNLEADAKREIANGVTAGINSNTNIVFKNGVDGKKVVSTHKLYLKGNYSSLKNFNTELGLTHDYHKATKKDETALRKIFFKAETSYDKLQDVSLTGKITFDHTLDGNAILYRNIIMEDLKDSIGDKKFKALYQHSYEGTASYKYVKDLELKGTLFAQHIYANMTKKDATNEETHQYTLAYGLKPEIKFTGIKNLTLSSKNLFAGVTIFGYDAKSLQTPLTPEMAFIKLNANAEYMVKATDKLTITPSIDTTSAFLIAEKTLSLLDITPKIATKYMPNKNLTLSADVSSKVRISNEVKINEFKYQNTTLKTNFSIKYTW